MEQKLPAVLAKKVWKLVRVVYYMLRKGISKRKLLLDLNMMIQGGKIAGKTLQNLMFHFHHDNNGGRKKHHSNSKPAEDLDMVTVNAVLKAMELIHNETASPAPPGFGRSPMVREMRVTDSPFASRSVDEDNHVDEAAEQFISRFYTNLRRQNTTAGFEAS